MDFSTGFQGLNIQFNALGWGPASGDRLLAFDDVPYASFDKKEKCGRHADFVSQSSQSSFQKPYFQKKRDEFHGNADFLYKHDAAEDSTFQLVDTSKAQNKKFAGGVKRQPGRGQAAAGRPQQNRSNVSNKRPYNVAEQYSQSKSKFNQQKNKLGMRSQKRQDRKLDRVPSLAVGAEWEVLEEFDLAQLLKLVANAPVVEDLAWHGHIDQYDEVYDKLTTRTAKPLRRIENKLFYDVTTSEDPILEKFAVEGAGEVYATDSIVAQLMAAPRSVYSWDIVIQKVNGMVFLDKRDDSGLDFLTVSETAHDPPNDELEEYNHPEKLSLEATMINQNFSQQVVLDIEDENRKSFEPNPFFDDFESGAEPASVAYRYRKFTLGNLKLVARCELHSWITKREGDQYLTCHALNEWDSKFSGGVNWRMKIDQQRGAVLATEIKNNSCKLAKWTAQAILAGASQMKIGYVSRAATTNPNEHVILATQFFKPKEIAQQINLNLQNIWGIIKMICELCMNKPDGKYVLMKDPNKAVVRLYSIPLNTFEEEEEEDAEDGEGDFNNDNESGDDK